MWSRKPMPVEMAICCVEVICTAWWAVGRGNFTFGYSDFCEDDISEEKWVDGSNAGRAPPSSEKEHWILVSFVSRVTVAVRRELEVSIEPMVFVFLQVLL
jgi:hypothetical protein